MGRNNKDLNDAYIASRGARYAETLKDGWDSRIGEDDKCSTCGEPATKFSWADGLGCGEHPV